VLPVQDRPRLRGDGSSGWSSLVTTRPPLSWGETSVQIRLPGCLQGISTMSYFGVCRSCLDPVTDEDRTCQQPIVVGTAADICGDGPFCLKCFSEHIESEHGPTVIYDYTDPGIEDD
jgi:hypothetical protein